MLIRARRPAGAQADFRVNLSGHLSYKFYQYKGKACEKDIAPVMATLQDAYGISLSDKRVIWVNLVINASCKTYLLLLMNIFI